VRYAARTESTTDRHLAAAQGASDQPLFLLAALPPSKWQIGLALGIVVALVVAFGATAPFADIQLPRVNAFIPALAACRTGVDFYVPAILLQIERLSLLKIIAAIADDRGGRFQDTRPRSKRVSKALSRG